MIGAFSDRDDRDDEDDQADNAKAEANRFHGLNLSGVALSSYEFAGCRVAIPRRGCCSAHPSSRPRSGRATDWRTADGSGRFVHDAIAAASLSASLLAARRVGCAVPSVELDPAKVATAVTSDKYFRLDGEPISVWAEFSGFWPCSDGWVRTHANYPHHRTALLSALELADDTGADEFMLALHAMKAEDLEQRVVDAGGVATVVRTPEQWAEHPQAKLLADLPVIELITLNDTEPAQFPETTVDAPLAGLRVLDLTRVHCGPGRRAHPRVVGARTCFASTACGIQRLAGSTSTPAQVNVQRFSTSTTRLIGQPSRNCSRPRMSYSRPTAQVR